MGKLKWWQCGLLGGFTLSLATLNKLIRALRGGAAAEWGEALGFAAMIFAMGFACGLVAWAGRGLSRRLGMVGDALVGAAVLVVLFLGCMLVFAPEALGPKFATAGVPMFGLAVAIGLFGGALIGRDIRKEIAKEDATAAPTDEDNPAGLQR
jgi:hypothetical protein